MKNRKQLVIIFMLAFATTIVNNCGEQGLPAVDLRQAAESMARDDIACITDQDCCIVFDWCLARGLLIHVDDQDETLDLLSQANQEAEACLQCIAPAIQAECQQGFCVASQLVLIDSSSRNYPDAASQNHCGKVEIPDGWAKDTATNSSSYQSFYAILGCGW